MELKEWMKISAEEVHKANIITSYPIHMTHGFSIY